MTEADPSKMNPRRVETLRAIMQALRTPPTGCPWDLEQSFETIVPYTIEEAYEVADAIARGTREDLCEELGDLLLPVQEKISPDKAGEATLDRFRDPSGKARGRITTSFCGCFPTARWRWMPSDVCRICKALDKK